MICGPSRPEAERIGALQAQLDELRTRSEHLTQALAAHAATRPHGSYERRQWARLARCMAQVQDDLSNHLPRWLPGLPIGADKPAPDGDGSMR